MTGNRSDAVNEGLLAAEIEGYVAKHKTDWSTATLCLSWDRVDIIIAALRAAVHSPGTVGVREENERLRDENERLSKRVVSVITERLNVEFAFAMDAKRKENIELRAALSSSHCTAGRREEIAELAMIWRGRATALRLMKNEEAHHEANAFDESARELAAELALTSNAVGVQEALEIAISEYARDLRRNSSGSDDYPWEIMCGVADHLDMLLQREGVKIKINETQIKYMVNRFLGWMLPDDFNPDAGISFRAAFNEHTAHPMRHEPTGTNLFDATQADAMVRYMIEGISDGT